jgi:hypothetical protein
MGQGERRGREGTVVESEGIGVLNTPSDPAQQCGLKPLKGKESFPRTDGRFIPKYPYARTAEARSSALKSKVWEKKIINETRVGSFTVREAAFEMSFHH